MTALAEQVTALGYYPTTAIADLAITAGAVYRDDNGQVRVAGSGTAIVADQRSASQVSSLTLNAAHTGTPHKGSGNNKW